MNVAVVKPASPVCSVGCAPEVSVVLPCLNEAETLSACLKEAQEGLRSAGVDGEIIVADNGSSDGSLGIAHSFGSVTVVNVQNKGYGCALRAGIDAANGEYVIIGDADGSYCFLEIPRFVEKLRDGYMLVMGNRFRGQIEEGAMPWHHRYIGNPVLTSVGRFLFRSKIGDFHCGLRGFSKSGYDTLGCTTEGMEFASELVIRASIMQQPVTEISTVLRRDGRSRRPHLRSWRDGWRHLRFMLLLSPKWLFMIPGFVMFCSSIVILAASWHGPISFGAISLDVNTMLVSGMLAVVSYQSMLLAVSAREIATRILLFPPDPVNRGIARFFSLEKGIVAGWLLCVLGLIWLVPVMSNWQQQPIVAADATRTMILAATLLMLGIQTILGGFFLGLLTHFPVWSKNSFNR